MLSYCLIIIVAALVGGAIPLLVGRSHRLLHALIAVSTGVFLGVVFTHLLPEVAHMAEESAAVASSQHAELHAELHAEPHLEQGSEGELHDGDSEGVPSAPFLHGHAGRDLWLFVLVGLLGIYLFEKLALAGRGHSVHDQHVALSLGSAFGLGVHAFTTGLGLSAAGARPELLEALFVSIAAHKSMETFSLTSVLMLADFPRRRVILFTALFALVTPLGVLLGSWIFEDIHGWGVAVLTSLATGTFLFVAVCDLLPEVFHHRTDMVLKLVLLALGVVVSLWI